MHDRDPPRASTGIWRRAHLHPSTVHMRLRALGISNLAARDRAIQDLVMEVPAPIVAKMLGYSDPVAARHAEAAGAPMSRYVTEHPGV